MNRWLVVAHDMLVLLLAWTATRLSASVLIGEPILAWQQLAVEINLILIIQGLLQWRAGLYRGVWRFASLPDLANLAKAAMLGAIAGIAVLLLMRAKIEVMMLVVWLFPVALLLGLSLPRLVYRVFKDMRLEIHQRRVTQRTVILGAGRSGRMLLPELRRQGGYDVVGFLDDDRALRNRVIDGVAVLGRIQRLQQVVREAEIDLVVIAMPSATNQQMQRIVALCEQAEVEFKTLPTVRQLGQSLTRFDDLKPVVIDDLLGREPVSLDWDGLRAGLSGRRVLVTGGGGSIGAELCEHIARLNPAALIVLDQSEFNLYRVDYQLRSQFRDLRIEAVLGDVCDSATVEQVMVHHRPEVVFHAAAYKHLPMLQTQLREAFRNNVLGTRRVADAAVRHGVDTFVMISTDKAVNPSNIMGATKRVAELYCQQLNATCPTRFITVRFGNVLNSTGSVVPLFNEQIRQGGPVTVTHPEITRYFMTISEAAQLILQSAVMGKGGEVFVLDMGEPVRISYLAEQLIRLVGKEPGRDIEIVYTGLRPGEKLYEELFHDHEDSERTAHEKILLCEAAQSSTKGQMVLSLTSFSDHLEVAERAVRQYDLEALRATLLALVPELAQAQHEGQKSGNVISLSA